jgi:hypothetical protein
MAYTTIVASFWIASQPGSNRVKRLRMRASRISRLGPDANAEARKRGAKIAVIQNGRASRPEYRNAVTVWMLIAHGIDK